ncbi:MAG: hypothetical protein AAF999_14995 [Pseudomonadota bacterium]
MRTFAFLLCCLLPVACGPLPDLEDTRAGGAQNITYAEFVPIDRVVLEQRDAAQRANETEEALEARVAGLRARAARLRAAQVE